MNKRFIFDRINIILFIAGIVLTTIGYIIMATGDISISVVLLTIAYLIVFPAAILWGAYFGKKKQVVTNEANDENMSVVNQIKDKNQIKKPVKNN